jgi:hypothetical protein
MTGPNLNPHLQINARTTPSLTGYPTVAPLPTMAGDGRSWAIRPHGAPILSWLMDIRRTGYDEHTGMLLTVNGRLVGAGRGDEWI